jgi:predicted DNA-binding transcriptional regulator AlpA
MDQNTIKDPQQILRHQEQCQLLGISRQTLWRLRGELPPEIKISRRVRGRRYADLERFLESRTIKAAE